MLRSAVSGEVLASFAGLKGAAFQAIGQALFASGLLLALTWRQSARHDRAG